MKISVWTIKLFERVCVCLIEDVVYVCVSGDGRSREAVNKTITFYELLLHWQVSCPLIRSTLFGIFKDNSVVTLYTNTERLTTHIKQKLKADLRFIYMNIHIWTIL